MYESKSPIYRAKEAVAGEIPRKVDRIPWISEVRLLLYSVFVVISERDTFIQEILQNNRPSCTCTMNLEKTSCSEDRIEQGVCL